MGDVKTRERFGLFHQAAARPLAEQRGAAAGQVAARRTALEMPTGISMADWRKIGDRLFAAADSSAWWLGDWLIYGQSAYPDRYRRAVEETDLDYQTLRNYAWVARRFAPARRRPALSFQHHAELASLPEQEQNYWMDRAERLNWSRNFLRARVKAAREADEQDDRNAISMRIQVNVSRDRRQRWATAAAGMEQDLPGWAMAILDRAAAAVLEEEESDHAVARREPGVLAARAG
ncbi:LmbU family transcriptional regulator [Streptomyces sp. NPDC004126]|uniref:LmbU family transcriptional regulator n=1 Tax=Streptomyces sp. NPDC004126 TaxID=3390695 RepID=UPI003D06C403